jgi:hypothetical protein
VVVAEQSFELPWHALYLAFLKVSTDLDVDIIVNLLLAFGFIGIMIAAWPKLQGHDRIYAVVIILISLSYYTGSLHPYMGLPRHLILAPTVFIGLTARLDNSPKHVKAIVLSQLVGTIIMVALYVWHAWVP